MTKAESCEKLVSNTLRNKLPSYYVVLDNVIIPNTSNNDIAQIDHLIVSPFGVFCIETKSHSGWIVGSLRRKNWTQTFYRGKSYKVHNPFMQNYSHTKAIEKLCKDLLKQPIVSLVIFPNAKGIVVNGRHRKASVLDAIDSMSLRTAQIYTREEFGNIIHRINNAQINDEASMQRHIAMISKKILAN